jgi:hypothetical protein
LPPARLRVYVGKGAHFNKASETRYLDFEISGLSHDFRIPMCFRQVSEVCA